MEKYNNLHIIIKDFRISNVNYEENPKLSELYNILNDEVKSLKASQDKYPEIYYSILLVEKLKIMSYIQAYFLNLNLKIRIKELKINVHEILEKQANRHSENFIATKFTRLKGLKINNHKKIEDLTSSFDINSIDKEVFVYDSNDYEIPETNFNYDTLDKVETFSKTEESSNRDSIDWEEIIMTTLNNNNGENFGY